MTIAGLINGLVDSMGRFFCGKDYRTPEWQRTPEDNPLDNALASIDNILQTREIRKLEHHRRDLKERGLDLDFYTIEVGSKQIYFECPALSVLVICDMDAKAQKELNRKNQREDLSLDYAITLAGLDNRVGGESATRIEFKHRDQVTKDLIVYRILRPYQFLSENDHGAYHETICDMFGKTGYDMPLLKAIAIADEIAAFLKQEQSRALPETAPFSEANLFCRSDLKGRFKEIFYMHLQRYNDQYNEDILTNPKTIVAESAESPSFENMRLISLYGL